MPQFHAGEPLERVDGEIKGGTELVDLFPNEDALVRVGGAFLRTERPRSSAAAT
ncbi:hypothetical protein ACVOMS_35735 (plasmid) [Bradyrhizobium guangxiense]